MSYLRMSLGNYTFSRNPNKVSNLLTPVRTTADVQTYGGVAFFSWGAMLTGKKITLDWTLCETAQYDAMETIYLADTPVFWTPQDGGGKKYSVEVLDYDGQLFMFLGKWWRQNVSMKLLILDEGVAV